MRRLIFLMIYFISFQVLGQSNEELVTPTDIAILARAQKDQILLRWAPKNPVSWELLNKYGYRLERYTIMRDSVILTAPEKRTLSTTELRPKPVEQWETMVEENDFAAIAAQAIYGETFEVNTSNTSDVMQVINKVNETESRFSYTLFAADQSYDVALMAGLAFTDNTAKPNEKYLYRIYSNVPEEVEKIDFGFVYVGLMDFEPLPKPYGLEAEFADKAVVLKWERQNFDHIYNSYWVEKSSDNGITYQRITDKPLINTSSNDNNRYMFKTDSLMENGKSYYYRVRGINSFGEISIPSDSVVGFGVKTIEFVPAISNTKVINNEKVNIIWEFPQEGVDQITGFKIEKSRATEGPYVLVDNYPIDVRQTIDENPFSTTYYRVKAFNDYSGETTSFPVLVQLQDSIPPAIPINLIGQIDSLGRVTISWQPNTETDLLGYRVYRSNFKNSEFGQITKEPVTVANFSDTVSIKTLTDHIYYKVLAVDKRFNPSQLSKEVNLKRPDVIPPVPPVFRSIKSVNEGIYLAWENSSSSDVAAHVIYKKKDEEVNWKIQQTITSDSIESIIDKEIEHGVYYNYTMIALDSSNLESLPARSVRGIKVDTGVRSKINRIKATVDRANNLISIQWEYSERNVKEFLIYRQREDEKLSLYTSVESDKREFLDKNLLINTNYQFRLKAVFKDGAESPFSEEIVVKY